MKVRTALVGPHGAGKSTLARGLVARTDRPVSYELERMVTSRARRPGEDDSEYDFVDQASFDARRPNYLLVQQNRNVPWWYALPKHRELPDNTVRMYPVIGETAQFLRSKYAGELVTCAILPPSRRVLEQRLRERDATLAEAEVQRRLDLGEHDTALAIKIADIIFYNEHDVSSSVTALADTVEGYIAERSN